MQNLILNEPRWQFKQNLIVYANSMSSDNPLFEKAQKTLAYMAKQERENEEKRIIEQAWLNSVKERLSILK